MALLRLFPRRPTFIWRYCVVLILIIYVLSVGLLLPLTSSTPKVRLDQPSVVLGAAEPTAATRNHSPPVSVPAALVVPPAVQVPAVVPPVPVVIDGRRPLDAGAAAAVAVDATKPPAPNKKPTDLEALHKNMTLHKANMSDIRQHVQAAVANRSAVNNASHNQHKLLANPHPFDYIINSPNVCAGDEEIYIIAYVHTAPDHYKRRVVIRQTWGDSSYYNITLRVVFVMGRGAAAAADERSRDVQRALEFEAAQYGDIVQEDFLDTYRNLTYKGVAALRWIARYCPGARYVLKTDDDIFVNAFNLLRHLSRLDRRARTPGGDGGMSAAAPRGLLLCLVWYSMTVMREGKWKVSRDEWPDDSYPTYCSGSAFLMTTDVAVAMYNVSYEVPFFWVDDFYITGLLPLKLGPSVVRHTQFISAYVLNGRLLENKFTGPQWYQYVFSHVHDLNAIQAVWKTVVRLARGEIQPTIPYALPGHLPKVTQPPPKPAPLPAKDKKNKPAR